MGQGGTCSALFLYYLLFSVICQGFLSGTYIQLYTKQHLNRHPELVSGSPV